MLVRLLALVFFLTLPISASAKLFYKSGEGDDGLNFVIVSGTFDYEDKLDDFERIVRYRNPTVVSFDSEGGNVAKAMELGRMIRRYGLVTVQLRQFECASSCALAFMGGKLRFAEPGSIGVHKASFAPSTPFNKDEAVSAVQEVTADIIGYMMEMGVNPSLLQLALKTDADDIRYLSGQEMADYQVTAFAEPERGALRTSQAEPSVQEAIPTSPRISSAPTVSRETQEGIGVRRYEIPAARSGIVRHPKGAVLVKARPDAKSRDILRVSNGTPLQIIGEIGRWYRVSVTGYSGYMHHTWIRVDQFDATPGMMRLIQIKSFDNMDEAIAYASEFDLPVSVFLATNGWYAITLATPYDKERALYLTRGLKRERSIPNDSFVTLGNTYVAKVCCDVPAYGRSTIGVSGLGQRAQ